MGIIPEGNLLQPRSKAETKFDATDRAARTIIEAEATRRDVKTARLRQARLDREAAEAAREKPVKAKAKAVTRRTKAG